MFRYLDLLYGLAFVILGIVIFAQLRATYKSRYKIVDILWLLAVFGIIHGAHEFVEMSILARPVPYYLEFINLLMLIISYAILFLFGYRLINISSKTKILGAWLPVLAAFLFLGLPLSVGPMSYTNWDVSVRYFLGFTGTMLSAVGLLLYYRSESDKLAMIPVKYYFLLCSFSFVLYGFSAGLVVPPADFPPASLLNIDSFTVWFGFPPETLRALAAAGTAFSIWQVMNIFNLEQAADREKAQAKLRQAYNELEQRVEERTDQLRQAKELSDALNRINGAINSTLDFEKIMQTVVNESGRAIGSEGVGVVMRGNRDWVVRHVYGKPQSMIGAHFTDEEAAGIAFPAITKEPFISNDAYNDSRLKSDLVRKYNIKSLLALPLIVRGEAAGVLYFSYCSVPVAFSEAQLDFGAKLAVSVSLAFENASLYATEHYIAETLQETLLTAPKELPGIEFSCKYQSPTDAAKVGGDFYDIFELEAGKIGIIIGDVSGKGIQASTLTSAVKNTIKAYAFEMFTINNRNDIRHTSLAEALRKTNQVVLKTENRSLFVTVFFGVLETESGDFVYCNAGHPQPVLKRKGGETFLLPVCSPAIGAYEGFEYVEGKEILAEGDSLIAYTDGITEARRGAELFGERRLLNYIENADVGVHDITEKIFGEIMEFAGGKLSDDVALLSLSLAHKAGARRKSA